MEKQWKLGEDVSEYDYFLGGITFDQLIVSLHSGSKRVTPEEVRKVVKELLEPQLEDMWFLVENNMNEIIERAMTGRTFE